MRLSLVTAAFFLGSSLCAAATETSALREFGEATCWAVLGDGVDGIDGGYYQETALAHGIDNVDYCGCVGGAFVEHAELQGALMAEFAEAEDEPEMMLSIIEANLSACLPLADSSDELDIGLDPFDPDYDLSEDIPAEDEVLDGDLDDSDWLGYDPVDAMTCLEVVRGDFPARGFDSEAIRAVITRRGLDLSELCTCTAMWMADQGEPLQDAIAASQTPGVEWGTALGRGVEACIAAN